MNHRGREASIAQRVARTANSPTDACPGRHCWVSDAADHAGVKRPGLLLEWRRASAGWEGRVGYVAELRPGQWALVEEWLPAVLLAPV